MREISIREGVNREGNVSKRRNYLSPSNKSVKTVAEEFLKKASRELLGDNKSYGKGPFKLQDTDEDDDMSVEPIMSGCIKVSVISYIPTAQHPNVQDILKIGSIMFFSVLVLVFVIFSEPTEYSNSKVNDLKINMLETRIKILEPRLDLKRHHEDRARQSGETLYELLDDMENLRID
ncbi:hypothetical protein Tco_0575008 [Tanacetum coccineum]